MASNSSSNIPSESSLSSPQLKHSEFMSLSLGSGYDFEFIPKLDSKYECSVCLLALRHPVQTICGHRFCKDCIISWMNGSNKECPIDKQPLSETSLFHDSCIEREILQLKVKCPNASLGCKNQVDLRYIEDHIHACIYQPVLCPNECSVTVLQRDLEQHLSSQCLHRLTQCESCEETFTYNHEQIHLSECGYVSVSCDLCGKGVRRGSLPEHRRVECPSAEVSCSFFEHGCQFKASRNDINKHCQSAVDYHIQLLSAAYKKINTLVLDLYRNVGQVASGNFNRQPSLRSQVSQSSITESPSNSSLSERTLENSLVGATGGPPTPNFGNLFNHFEKPDWNVDGEMRNAQQSMMEPGKGKSKNDSGDLKPVKGELPEQELILRNLSNKCIDMNQRIMEETIKIDNLIRKVNNIDYVCRTQEFENSGRFCNGTFVWRIPNFSIVCEEMEKKKKIFHSPPFYSSSFGYKFCLRTNLNMNAEETSLTLYIHAMQSKNDDYLSWPFRGKISFSILDCKEGAIKKHFVEDMEVTGAVDAFKRPTDFRSIKGYGFKEFIPLDQIFNPTPSYNYLKHNVLYVKVVVVAN